VAALIDSVLPLVPGLVENLERGIKILDIGCGRGRALNVMAKHFPKSTFIGFDISDEAIRKGSDDTRRDGLGTMWGEEKAIDMLGEAGFPKWDIKKRRGSS
jgi:trans-aconitate methyltransferase